MALVNELADEPDLEPQRFAETMQRRFAEQRDVFTAQFTHNQGGIRNFLCLVCSLAYFRRTCPSHADPGKGHKSYDGWYSDHNHNRHDIKERLASLSGRPCLPGKTASRSRDFVRIVGKTGTWPRVSSSATVLSSLRVIRAERQWATRKGR